MRSGAELQRLHQYVDVAWAELGVPQSVLDEYPEDYHGEATAAFLGARWDQFNIDSGAECVVSYLYPDALCYYFPGYLWKYLKRVTTRTHIYVECIVKVHSLRETIFDSLGEAQLLALRKLCKVVLDEFHGPQGEREMLVEIVLALSRKLESGGPPDGWP